MPIQNHPPPPMLEPGADLALVSTLTCPECGAQAAETMPTDACWFFYDCGACGARLKPKPGHCCVFCSYGTLPCPPVQACGDRPSPAEPGS
ncbi:MAG TPA: GDCCVxC domain-containing (seleno)protein [Caulobacteraceae bacterium]|jgi:hypothetical protein